MSGHRAAESLSCSVYRRSGIWPTKRRPFFMPTGNVRAKFSSFGWYCIECDGHDIESLYQAFETAKTIESMARHRKVTACARVQMPSGLKMLAPVPRAIRLPAAQSTASQ